MELSQSEREAQIPADQAKDELSMQRVMFSQLSSAISRYHSSSKGLYLLRASFCLTAIIIGLCFSFVVIHLQFLRQRMLGM